MSILTDYTVWVWFYISRKGYIPGWRFGNRWRLQNDRKSHRLSENLAFICLALTCKPLSRWLKFLRSLFFNRRLFDFAVNACVAVLLLMQGYKLQAHILADLPLLPVFRRAWFVHALNARCFLLSCIVVCIFVVNFLSFPGEKIAIELV